MFVVIVVAACYVCCVSRSRFVENSMLAVSTVGYFLGLYPLYHVFSILGFIHACR